jgi:UDP-GlcNAc:undecaprenyl-phosphate GlcNAc-1-phosphate transferase
MEWALVIFFSFISAVILIPSAGIIGKRLNIVDRPGDRKIHDKVVPCTGGFAFFVIYFLSALFLFYFCSGKFGAAGHSCLINTAAAMVVIGLLGIFDDVRGAGAKIKFLVQIVAALIVMSSGVVLDRILIPYDGSVSTGLFTYPLTLVWIVGITNAYNLIDGLDGLACCIAAGVAAVISVIGFMNGNVLPATFAAVISVSSFTFYFFNRYPAKIFLGDTGSLLLGFLIAVTSIECLRTEGGSVAFFPMVLVNGLVIGDTVMVFMKRLIAGRSPFAGDLDHVHHRMLRHTGSIKASVRVLFAVTMLLAICGIALLYVEGIKVVTSMLTAMVGLTLFFSKSARDILAVLLSLSGRGENSPEENPD